MSPYDFYRRESRSRNAFQRKYRSWFIDVTVYTKRYHTSWYNLCFP